MSQQTTQSDLIELSKYIKGISEYEARNFRSESSLVRFSWGVVLILAGVADLNVSFFAGYSPHFFVWLIFVFFGFILQKMISTQPVIHFSQSSTTRIRPSVEPLDMIITGAMFIGTIIISFLNYIFILPFISMMFGIASLSAWSQQRKILFASNETENPEVFSPIRDGVFFIATAIVLLIIGVINPFTQLFQGLVLGLAGGGNAMYHALRQRSHLFEYQQKLQTNEEILENQN